ncbi:MAG: hypothetical protein ACOYVJ_08420 [Nitrospirota bacterium]
MKNFSLAALIVGIIAGFLGDAGAAEMKQEGSFFTKSLHATTGGMAYWYDRENGGLETLSGIPYQSDKLDCLNCHIGSCDRCHAVEADGKSSYSTQAAKNQDVCLSCHKRARAIRSIDAAKNQPDVHVARDMQCMDCHTARDVHGDGRVYSSMKEQGAIDAHCEKCHAALAQSTSHRIHGDKLECKACHIRRVVSCTNCHIDTVVNEKKRVDIKVTDWVFLMNYNGKVTSANMQNFVVSGNRTFLIFAPQNSHSIMKDGRKCGDCHATEIVKKIRGGKISLTWLENGEVRNTKGVIPVVEGVIYDTVYQNYQDGKWIPIDNPAPQKLQYVGYGSPLTLEQVKKLAMPVGK